MIERFLLKIIIQFILKPSRARVSSAEKKILEIFFMGYKTIEKNLEFFCDFVHYLSRFLMPFWLFFESFMLILSLKMSLVQEIISLKIFLFLFS